MFEASLNGLISVFTWPTFPLMMIGVLIGFIIGILPGISAPTTLALMLPFTFHMTPVEAFAFLLGMLSVSIMFGDVTSILFGVPGEPLAAAVVLDGHPMAKKGETGRALGAALMSSLVGAAIGAFILAASIPIIRPIVLAFASPEFFGLALLGIAFVAALSGGKMTKGVLMGAVGLMLSMIGLDPQSGTQRYTFGQLELWDGIGLIPVTVGMFGVGELVDLWVKQKSISERRLGKIGGLWQGCKDTFIYWGVTVRCSLLGTFLGIIPGLGGSVGQWVSYAHAVQSAEDKGGFGKGDVRGVLGPGAAMNAKEGGNLITTVAFGVPSSVSMAILLGAFLIQGLVPGPSMLTTRVELTLSFVWVIIVSHVISVALCFLLINQMVRITEIRSSLILPGIVFLVLFGGFSEKNSIFDMGITLVAGFAGMIMIHLDWPRPPLILGLVLGKLIENNLFISYSRYEFGFFTRPVLLVIIAIGIALVVAPLVQERLARRLGVKEKLVVAEEG
ncbi:MAG TPA: tripartite tricarboxylate transporter permease [Chloroflexota bacterium]|nr:tripartite tricarboxylate transporter permease [Chloroflexota bacterium]